MSDWLENLRAECDRTNQARTARRLGVSPAMVNQVLNGAYKSDTSNIEARVRGELMRETVPCSVMGDISKRRCVDIQAQPFAPTNPDRVAVYRACRDGCPFSSLREDG